MGGGITYDAGACVAIGTVIYIAPVALNMNQKKWSDHEFETSPPAQASIPPTQFIDEAEVRSQVNLPQKFGPYELLREIGRGGMGTVWLAKQEQPVKRSVALKVIRPELAVGELLVRFEAERQALAMMNHPHVARILDAGTTPDGQPFFSMEYVAGQPLNEYCDENRLSVEERLRLFLDVCSGVQHAHQKGIIHRDLKPSNILVSQEQGKAVAKVIDFGLAKAMQGADRLTQQSLFTQVGQILGTYQYMSPEQANLDEVDIDTRTDVYALGVVLYELLTGCTPLEKSTLKEMRGLDILEMIRDHEPTKPSNRLSTVNNKDASSVTSLRQTDSRRLKQILLGDLDWITMRALERDRTRRYPSVASFADDVQRYLQSEPVSARPPSLAYRARKYARKHRLAVVTGGLIAATILFCLIGLSLAYFEVNRAYVEATQERKNAEANFQLARQGFEIMGSVFEKLDPQQPQNTAAELRRALSDNLANALPKLDAMAGANPLEIADIQNTLGISLNRLGNHEQAIKLLLKAAETRKIMLGEDDLKTLGSLNNLATSYRAIGELDKALELSQAITELMIRKHGDEHRDTIIARNNLANGLRLVGRMDDAIKQWEALLEPAKEIYGEASPGVVMVMNNLASGYSETDRIDDSVKMFEDLVQVLEDSNNPNLLTVKGNLATVYVYDEKPDKAISIYQELAPQLESRFGENSIEMFRNTLNLAEAYAKKQNCPEAIKIYEAALAGIRQHLPEDNHEKLSCMFGLGTCYRQDGHTESAFDTLAEAIDLIRNRRVSLPENVTEKIPGVLQSLVQLSAQLGRPEESEKYRQLLEEEYSEIPMSEIE